MLVVTADANESIHPRMRAFLAPGAGRPPMHVHPEEAESFDVHEGELTLVPGDDSRTLGHGDQYAVEPGVQHTVRNDAEEVAAFATAFPPTLDVLPYPLILFSALESARGRGYRLTCNPCRASGSIEGKRNNRYLRPISFRRHPTPSYRGRNTVVVLNTADLRSSVVATAERDISSERPVNKHGRFSRASGAPFFSALSASSVPREELPEGEEQSQERQDYECDRCDHRQPIEIG